MEKIPLDFRKEYDEKGFVIIRNAIDPDLSKEMVQHVRWLTQRNPDVRPERLGHQFLVHDPFMHRLVGDDRLLDIVEQFLGINIALFAAHYIAKRPNDGQAVQWHQDGSYWPLEPMEVTTLWVAGTRSAVENGCMRVLPGTQSMYLLKRRELTELDPKKYVLGIGIHPNQIDDSNAVDIELNTGDISIHNSSIIHGSNANRSDQWRVGLTLRYIPTTTRVKRKTHENILLRGKIFENVKNLYAKRPQYIPGEHLPFRGCETWNEQSERGG